MPLFDYKAIDDSGKITTGVVSADTPKEARAKLREDGLLPSDVKESHIGPSGIWTKLPRIFRRKDEARVAIMTRQFSTLMATGVALTDALNVLIKQTNDNNLERTLKSVRESVMRGDQLADALEKHPLYFNELYINMVRSGEASGNLDRILERVANYTHVRMRMQSKMIAALTYPAVMLSVGIIVVVFLLTFVVPKIEKVLMVQKKQLPWPTEFMLALSNFVRDFWWAIILSIIGVFFIYRMLMRIEKTVLWRDRMILKLPIFGVLLQKTVVSNFAHTFSTLLSSGIPVTDSLEIVRRTVSNKAISKTIGSIREKIIEGSDIASTIQDTDIFPPMVSYMVAVGETTGRLEQVLERLATSYDEEIEISAQKMISLLEPIMIVCLAVFVGFIALSIVLPIMEMSNTK